MPYAHDSYIWKISHHQLINLRKCPECDMGSKAKNLDWGYEHGSQPNFRFTTCWFNQLDQNNIKTEFSLLNLHLLIANKRSLEADL